MEPVGEQLRKARLARNLTIEDIAAVTKIRPGYLEYLEEGEHERLPGQFFVVSFVNQYATALGLDVDATVDALRRELPEGGDVPLTLENFAPSGTIRYFLGRANSRIGRAIRRNARTAAKLALAVMLIGGSFFWLFKWYDEARTLVDVESTSDPMQAPPGAEEPIDELSEASPSPTEAAAGAVPSTSDPALGSLNVEIQATHEVWVRSISDGGAVREAILQPGERQQIRGNSFVRVTFGNAGGAVLVINGEQQDAIGPLGAVRHVRVTKDGWDQVSPDDF